MLYKWRGKQRAKQMLQKTGPKSPALKLLVLFHECAEKWFNLLPPISILFRTPQNNLAGAKHRAPLDSLPDSFCSTKLGLFHADLDKLFWGTARLPDKQVLSKSLQSVVQGPTLHKTAFSYLCIGKAACYLTSSGEEGGGKKYWSQGRVYGKFADLWHHSILLSQGKHPWLQWNI